MVDWDYFDKFKGILKKYMPKNGEGKTKASQIVTAVNKLIYKYYNDGDVFDNTYYLPGWENNESSFANWLYLNTNKKVKAILSRITECMTYDDYEDLLKDLADELLDYKKLEIQEKMPKIGSIYKCDGPFEFVFNELDDDDDFEDYPMPEIRIIPTGTINKDGKPEYNLYLRL